MAHSHEIVNPETGGFRCIECFTDMGSHNPRQLCGKWRCESPSGFCAVCFEEAAVAYHEYRGKHPVDFVEETAFIAGYLAAQTKKNVQ